MCDDLEDNQEDYRSLTHEDWCDLLYKIKVRDNRKRELTQINKITSTRKASNYDSDRYIGILRKKKARTGVFQNNKGPNTKSPKNHNNQRHCTLCKKAGMTDRNYMLHNAEECLGKHYNKNTINNSLGGPMGSRAKTVKQYKRSGSKQNKELREIW